MTTAVDSSGPLLRQGIAIEALGDALTAGDETAVRTAVNALVNAAICPADCPLGTQSNLEEGIAELKGMYPDLVADLQEAIDALPES